jgi:hypothetical protein
MADLAKQLKIKSGALRRNIKDIDVAHKEIAREQARLDAEADEDKKVQLRRVIEECSSMLPLGMKRVQNTMNDLEEFLAGNEEELAATLVKPAGAAADDVHPDVAEAKRLISEADALLA